MMRQVVGFPLHMSATQCAGCGEQMGACKCGCPGCTQMGARLYQDKPWFRGIIMGAALGAAALVLVKPPHEKKAALGLGIGTALLMIYRPLGLPWGVRS